MNMRRILVGTIVLGIVGNAIDWLLNTYVWASMMSAMTWVNPSPPMMWIIIANFAAAFMFMLMWDRFSGSVGGGAGAGFRLGLFAGAFINFPAVLGWQLYIKGFEYTTAWKFMVVGILWYGVLGIVASMLDGKKASA